MLVTDLMFNDSFRVRDMICSTRNPTKKYDNIIAVYRLKRSIPTGRASDDTQSETGEGDVPLLSGFD